MLEPRQDLDLLFNLNDEELSQLLIVNTNALQSIQRLVNDYRHTNVHCESLAYAATYILTHTPLSAESFQIFELLFELTEQYLQTRKVIAPHGPKLVEGFLALEQKLELDSCPIPRDTRLQVTADINRFQALIAIELGEYDKAMNLLTYLLNFYEQRNEPFRVVVVATDLYKLYWMHFQNISAAVEFLMLAANKLDSIEDERHKTRAMQALAHNMQNCAYKLYYELKDYEAVVRVAWKAAELTPEDTVVWLLLGHAFAKLNNIQFAADSYRRVLELEPDDPKNASGNLASMLLVLNKTEEVEALLHRSIAKNPEGPVAFIQRAQIREMQEDWVGAIADFEQASKNLDSEYRHSLSNVPGEHGYFDEQRRAMRFKAYSRLFELYSTANHTSALHRTINRAKNSGDKILIGLGLRSAAQLAFSEHNLDDALAYYSQALNNNELDCQARKSRALIYLQKANLNAFFDDVACLAGHDHDPDEAIDCLQLSLAQTSGDTRADRCFGIAHYNHQQFEKAVYHFQSYLNSEPNDAEIHRLLGLTLFSVFVEDGKAASEKFLSRIFDAISHLATAAQLNDQLAKDALIWFFDRMLLSADMLLRVASHPAVESTFPGFRSLLHAIIIALSDRRNYEQRSKQLGEVIERTEKLGFVCLPMLFHISLADIHLVLGQLQHATEHIQKAKRFDKIILSPLSAALQVHARELANRNYANVSMEFEYMFVYSFAMEAIETYYFIVSRYELATGRNEKGFEDLDSIKASIGKGKRYNIQPYMQMLRDCNRHDDAIALFEYAKEQALFEDDQEKWGELLATAGIIYFVSGDYDKAIELMSEGQELMPENRRWVAQQNIASVMVNQGKNQDAVALLEQTDINSVARSEADKYIYHLLFGISLMNCEKYSDSLTEILHAIRFAESQREQLKNVDLRIEWTEKANNAYEYGLMLAIREDQPELIFALSERKSSRVFIDELVMGRGAGTQKDIEYEAHIANLERQLEELNALEPGPASGGNAYALNRLKLLNENLELMKLDSTGVETIAKEALHSALKHVTYMLKQVREEAATHRIESAEQLFGTPLQHQELLEQICIPEQLIVIKLIELKDKIYGLISLDTHNQPVLVELFQNIDASAWIESYFNHIAFNHADNAARKFDDSALKSLLNVIENEVAEGKTICFIPNGVTHRIPFHTLRIKNQYLIQRHPVFYAPSATILAHLKAKKATENEGAFVLGDTRGDLPYAASEASAIADILAVKQFASHKATCAEIKKVLKASPNLKILHLACHGYFNHDDALSSGILTADDRGGQPNILSARDLQQVAPNADLVALSACESGLSDIAFGDELMGLNRAILVGGARSTLSSHWRVNDISTHVLMRLFYQAWILEGMSKVQALRHAQCTLMSMSKKEAVALLNDASGATSRPITPEQFNADEKAFGSPNHWAAFSLTGDWR